MFRLSSLCRSLSVSSFSMKLLFTLSVLVIVIGSGRPEVIVLTWLRTT